MAPVYDHEGFKEDGNSVLPYLQRSRQDACLFAVVSEGLWVPEERTENDL